MSMNASGALSNATTSKLPDALRLADERIQRILTALLILSVVVLIAQWKAAGGSLVYRRYDRLRNIYSLATTLPETLADDSVRRQTFGRFVSRDELHAYLSQMQLTLAKMTIVDLPGLGVSVDVSDLGLISGVAYAGLLLLLVFALAQSHETQYLALRDINAIYLLEGPSGPGAGSVANQVYQSLAATQFVMSPPTLAQWSPARPRHMIVRLVFVLPLMVQTWLVLQSVQILKALRQLYGLTVVSLLPEVILLTMVLALGVIASLHYSAALNRWSATFFRINPVLRILERPTVWTWLNLRTTRPSYIGQRLANQVVAQLSIAEPPRDADVPVSASLKLSGPTIRARDISEMCAQLEIAAAKTVANELYRFQLTTAEVMSSVLHDDVWEVTAHFGVTAGERRY